MPELPLEPESVAVLMRRRWPRTPGDDVEVEQPVELTSHEQAWLCAYELQPAAWRLELDDEREQHRAALRR